MFKKVLSVIMCIVTLISVLSVSVSAKNLTSKNSITDSARHDSGYSAMSITAKNGEELSLETFKEDMKNLEGGFLQVCFFTFFGVIFYGMALLAVPTYISELISDIFAKGGN